jgi:hypothetical protein
VTRKNPTPFNSTHKINVNETNINEWKLFTWMRRTKINLNMNMPYVDALVNSEDGDIIIAT